ncbi:MAG TPA: DNA translocase FtsK 4TM domain-containing protein [Terriglobia bacterium]|nr:DNA translocase FtsK 4TM domain-containing protein [Terriglobia bacterium]
MAQRSWTAYLVPTEHRRVNEFVGLLLLTIAILLGLSLISFNPDDPSFNISRNPLFAEKATNFIGVLGAYVADVFFQAWGSSAFLIPIFLGVYAFFWLASRPVASFGTRLSGMILMIVALSASLSLSSFRVRDHIPAGGLFGNILADNLRDLVNPAGTAIILISTFLISLLLATTFSFAWAVAILKPRFRFVGALAERWAEWQANRARERALERAEPKEKTLKKQTIVTDKAAPAASRAVEPGAPVVAGPAPRSSPPVIKRKSAGVQPASTEFPSTALLHSAAAAIAIDEDELRSRARLIEQKAAEFEVEGNVQQIHPGPVVTTFEFKPEAGVKYSRITSLGDDLCLALEAESVRIDRIPGKSTVGIEVPNNERATIVLRELLESSEYHLSTYRLPLALGKDHTGKIVVSDLQKMPHLLAAGSTGTGKSVSINAMILSLLFRARPDQVKMILIDPKRLELGLYQDIPHLLVPVVTEPKIAQNALRWAVVEMESRYKKLARRGVRNLEVYNEQVKQLPIPGLNGQSEDEEDRETLPYIVIVIDELADLMMTAPREVEESITRLAQMARAVGIHLILATQRPSVDVITGLIKANFPARISFRVASKVDSRTILDSNGAETLLGRGDMLFLPPGSSRLMRVHGPLITEEEVMQVVDFLKKQGKPTYNERILESPEERADLGEPDGDMDPLYDDAVKIVIEMGKASTSALQRRLRIGYGRAASLLDAMERDGIIGPPDGSKPRAVLISREDYLSEP